LARSSIHLAVLLLGFATGCLHQGATGQPAAEDSLHYTFDLTATTSSALRGPDGTEPTTSAGPAGQLVWSGTIQQAPTRRFRDGSQGAQIRFGEVSLSQGDGQAAPSDLSGLAVELRSFGNRDILAIDQLEHLVGEGLWGDQMLALWPALSPSVPELEPGESTRRRSSLPFTLEDGMGIPIALDLDWSLEGPVACGQVACWQLRYAGTASGRGLERTESWLARYRLSGQASGTLLMAVEDHTIVDSELTLALELEAKLFDPATQTPRGGILMDLHQHAKLTRIQEAP